MIEYYKEAMLSYCLKCRKNPKGSKTSNGKIKILSKCAICGSKKSKLIRFKELDPAVKGQKVKGLLSNLGLRTPLNKIPVLGDILF